MEPLQHFVNAAIASIVRPAPLSAEKVLFAWRLAVGPALARATRVTLSDTGAVEAAVDTQHWGDELERSAPLVLERMRNLIGEDVVNRIDIIRPPVPQTRRRGQWRAS
jgi:predicted nucleic acid-binding Zn ribbon protein